MTEALCARHNRLRSEWFRLWQGYPRGYTDSFGRWWNAYKDDQRRWMEDHTQMGWPVDSAKWYEHSSVALSE
jgi:hypothetical protein